MPILEFARAVPLHKVGSLTPRLGYGQSQSRESKMGTLKELKYSKRHLLECKE
jgi:hypothetical protein